MNNRKLGLNQESIQASNRALLLELIRKEGVCSRAFLARKSRLQQSTVTTIVNSFIKWGLVVETGLITGKKGRRSIGISINTDTYAVLGVRIIRSGFSIGLFNLTGGCIIEKNYEVGKNRNPSDMIHKIVSEAQIILSEKKQYRVLSAGIAVPGPFNMKDGTIILMTESEGWNAFNLSNVFQQELKLPTILQHDARAGAWSQLWHNKKDHSEGILVYISVGQGVGSGILVNGETLEGSIGAAGEIGHMSINYEGIQCECGNRGCLEKYTSSVALTKTVNQTLNINYSFSQIADRIRAGDKICTNIYEKCCDLLACGIVNVINCLNPNEIVLGDVMAKISPRLMLERVNKIVKERILSDIYDHQQISVDEMNINAELYGAAIEAIRDIFKNTAEYFSIA